MATGRRAVAVSPGGSLASARRLGHVTQRPERRFLRGRVGACVRGAWTEPGVQRARDQRWLPSRSPVMSQGEGTPVSSLHAAGGVSARASWLWGSPSPPPGEPAQEEGADQQEGAAGHCGQRSRSAGVSQSRLRKRPQGPGLPPAVGSAFPSPHAAASPTGFPGRLGTRAGRNGGPGAAWGALPPRAGSFWGHQAGHSLQEGSKARPQARTL